MSQIAAYMPSRLMRRLAHRRAHALPTAPASSLTSRTEVCPPQLWPSSLTWWGRMHRWLLRDNPWTPASARPANRLTLVRFDFQRCMDRVQGVDAARLTCQIECARSLRELWHLRSALYGLLALQFDQAEADRCMSALNRHFPTRVTRSGFGNLDS